MRQNMRVKFSLYISILGLLFLVVGSSFALLQDSSTSEKQQVIRVGAVKLEIIEASEGITLNNLQALTDDEGMIQESYYEFTVSNIGDANAEYTISLIDDTTLTSNLDASFIKAGLEINGSEIKIVNLSEVNRMIDDRVIAKGENVTYKLRLWLDSEVIESSETTVSENDTLNLNLKIDATQFVGEVYNPLACFTATLDTTTNTAILSGYDASCGTDVIIPEQLPVSTYTLVENPSEEAINNCATALSNTGQMDLTSAQTLCDGSGTYNGATLEQLLADGSYGSTISDLLDGTGMLDATISTELYVVTQIKQETFNNKGLTNVVIPDSVTTIGDYAFRNNNLTSIIIPNSVTTIGSNAFSVNALTSITLGNSIETIGTAAFMYNYLTDLEIVDSVETIGNSAFGQNNLKSVLIGENSNLTEISGIEYRAFSSTNYTYTVEQRTYENNPNLTIYNNSGKAFTWIYAVNGSDSETTFVTGTVPSYTANNNTYNEVTITTGTPE